MNPFRKRFAVTARHFHADVRGDVALREARAECKSAERKQRDEEENDEAHNERGQF